MKKFISKLVGLTLCAAACMPVAAQKTVQNMTIHFNDGTTEKVRVDNIKEVEFSPEEQKSHFTMTALDAYEYYIKFTLLPDDPDMTYNAMYLEKSEYDKYASEEDVVAADLQYFQDYADFYEMELSEILSYWLYTGDLSECIIDSVQPNTEYVIWYYGMDTNGNLTTPFEKVVVKTGSVEKISNTLQVETAVDGTTATLKVTPDDKSLRYFTGVLPANSASSEEDIAEKMQTTICNNLSSYVYDLGGEDTECLQEMTYTGEQTQTFTGLDANTEYYIIAGYVNDHFAIVSPLAYEKVTTGEASASAAPAKVAEKAQTVEAATLRPAMKTVKRHTIRPLSLKK